MQTSTKGNKYKDDSIGPLAKEKATAVLKGAEQGVARRVARLP